MIKSKAFLLTSLLIVFTCLTTSGSVMAQKSKARPAKVTPTPPVVIVEVEPQSIEENWKPFTSVEGRFSITAPGGFIRNYKTAQTPDGPIQMNVFTCFANAEYSITYADYLVVIEGNERMSLFLDGVRDSGVKGIKGRLLEEKEIMVDGHPGRTYRVEYGKKKDHLLVGRNVVVGQRLYIIAATYGKKEFSSKGSYAEWAQRFLDSFKVTKAAG